jgi:hypothetical protein
MDSCSCHSLRGSSTSSSRRSCDSIVLTRPAACVGGLDARALPGPVVVGHLALGPQRSPDRLLPLALRLLHQAGALVVVLLVGLARLLAPQRPRLHVGLEAAVVERGRAGRLVEVQDRRHRPRQELAVVRDDDQPGLQAEHELLEPLQAGEVEVVGRLVEQEDVVAREQHAGQRRPRRLAARQRHGLGVEQVQRQTEVDAHLLGPHLQVGAAEVEPALERGAVGVVGTGRPRAQRLRRGVQRALRGGDAGPAGEERAQHLTGAAVRLLREQPHGGSPRRDVHRAAVGLQLAGEHRQQRRLPGAVRTDHADPGAGATVSETPDSTSVGPRTTGQSSTTRVA